MKSFYLLTVLMALGTINGQVFNLSDTNYDKGRVRQLAVKIDAADLAVGETVIFTLNAIETCLDPFVTTSAGGINQKAENLQINPNPTSIDQETSFVLEMPADRRATVQIWTMNGQLLEQQVIQLIDGYYNGKLNTSIPPGVYNLKATGDQTVLVKSFVVAE